MPAQHATKRAYQPLGNAKDAPAVINPKLFHAIEVLCRDALQYGGNATGIRNTIITLVSTMRQQAWADFGHDTVDVSSISSLLQRTDPAREHSQRPLRAAEKDPIQELVRQAHLNGDQERAADIIRHIWRAWGRYLSVAARTFEKRSNSARERALDPFWVMGEDDFLLWIEVYRPWYEVIKKELYQTRIGGTVSAARIVIHAVTIPMFPGRIDVVERLETGTSLRVLKSGLLALAERNRRA